MNLMILSGSVCKTPICKVSPSGIPHCQFVLEHRSSQQEAGSLRTTWCYMPVVVSGYKLQMLTHSITIGSRLTVQGFISCHIVRHGLNKLVLHADKIELIDSGD